MNFKEVKRKAIAGEWIKVVMAYGDWNCYSNGDILQVVESSKVKNEYSEGIWAGTYNTHPTARRDGRKKQSFLYDNEYVVLEGYDPKVHGNV